MDKEVKRDLKHFERFREALGFPVEPRKAVTDAAVRALDEVRLPLHHRVRHPGFHLAKRDAVAAVGVCVDRRDVRAQGLYLPVNGPRRRKPGPYLKRNNALFPPRKSSPNDCSFLFFLTNV
jgi:hypothetical protein